ncbi:MAG TPA: hypothetical protein V6D05_11295 [Stenomitos sp.]
MTDKTKKALLAATVSMTALAGCTKAPTTPAPVTPNPGQATVVKNASDVRPVGGTADIPAPPCPQPGAPGVPAIFNADCRFIAFTACRPGYYGDQAGSLFLYDDAIKDVYVLNGALAGLNSQVSAITGSQKAVQGPGSCSELEEINPFAFADGKVLFSFGHYVYVYDMVAEERVAVAFDGQSARFGGPRATVTADGHLLAYVSNRGTVVLKETDGAFYTKTRELTKIAAEANVLGNINGQYYGATGVIYDLAISGDGRWLALNIDGILFLYDVLNPHLFQLLPLGGDALAGKPDRIGHVAISFDGRFIAFTVNRKRVDKQQVTGNYLVGDNDSRLLVLDRQTGYIDTVPYANLGDTITGSNYYPIILDPVFCNDGRSLFFEILVGNTFKVWRYDLLNETLRALVILNNVLGEDVDNTLVSQPNLDP